MLALPVEYSPASVRLSSQFRPRCRHGEKGATVANTIEGAFRLAWLPREIRPLVGEALRIASGTGAILHRRFRTGVAVRAKGPADIVTAADIEAQAFVEQRLRRAFPDHGLLAEEGLDAAPDAEWRWILDPLDGTKNFARGIATFCVSIAAERRGRVELGVVYDPVHEELFLGIRGGGAWCNGRPIRVSGTRRLAQAFLATGCPHRVRSYAASVGRTFGRFCEKSLGVRDRGAGALDLCYVACGRLDGYWEIDQSPWDIAAGGLIVKEAGGRMSDFRGGPFDAYGGETVASNGRIHRQILAVLAMPGGIPARH
ncbi:MAG: inositol monophosphatase, partial [Zetaproteobacteria bacterium]